MCTRKPDLANTCWSCTFQEFIADAGNETVTFTLKFVSKKAYVLETESYLPPYPGMRMNHDGSVDMHPGHHNQQTSQGTYSVNKDIITLQAEDGTTRTLRYAAGKIESEELFYRPVVFTKDE